MPDEPRTIEAARVTCDIIDLLQERGQAGITELADELGRSKSSVHAYLTTLVDEGYVVTDRGRYSLSLRYLDLAEHVKDQVGTYDVIRSETDKLAESTDEVAQFATLEGDELVYLYKARGESGVETMSSIGSREALHSTSLGKALLSHLTDERVRELVGPGPLPRKTEHTITDVDAFVEELRATRERGYAVDDEENIVGLRCIAAPVVLDEGVVLGAISVTGPSSRMTFDRIEDELEDRLKRAANVVQINTKFADDGTPTRGISRGVVSEFRRGGTATSDQADAPEPAEPLHETEFGVLADREWCKIQPVHSGKALEVHEGSTADGTQVQQSGWRDGEMQKFRLTRLAGDAYRIDAVHSGKPIEVENASTTNGANIQQNAWTGGDHQQWRIERLGDGGTFRLVNVNSDKVLDVVGEDTEDGASVIQWDWTGGGNQRFRF